MVIVGFWIWGKHEAVVLWLLTDLKRLSKIKVAKQNLKLTYFRTGQSLIVAMTISRHRNRIGAQRLLVTITDCLFIFMFTTTLGEKTAALMVAIVRIQIGTATRRDMIVVSRHITILALALVRRGVAARMYQHRRDFSDWSWIRALRTERRFFQQHLIYRLETGRRRRAVVVDLGVCHLEYFVDLKINKSSWYRCEAKYYWENIVVYRDGTRKIYFEAIFPKKQNK